MVFNVLHKFLGFKIMILIGYLSTEFGLCSIRHEFMYCMLMSTQCEWQYHLDIFFFQSIVYCFAICKPTELLLISKYDLTGTGNLNPLERFTY
jgi:hypothetical protein